MNFTRESSHPLVFRSRRLVLSVWPLQKPPLVSHLPFGLSRYPVINWTSAHFGPIVIVWTGVAAALAPVQLEFDPCGSGGRVKAAGAMCAMPRWGSDHFGACARRKNLDKKNHSFKLLGWKRCRWRENNKSSEEWSTIFILCYAALRFRSYSQGQM